MTQEWPGKGDRHGGDDHAHQPPGMGDMKFALISALQTVSTLEHHMGVSTLLDSAEGGIPISDPNHGNIADLQAWSPPAFLDQVRRVVVNKLVFPLIATPMQSGSMAEGAS